MSCVSWIVCLLLTFVIPLRLTYKSIKESKETKLWATYWGFYTLIGGLYWLLPFLQEAPFNLVFIVFLVWLYHESFRGALLINDEVVKMLSSNPALSSNINLIAQKAQFLRIFESTAPVSKDKTA